MELTHSGPLPAQGDGFKYALLSYGFLPGNVGDAIQSVAAGQFLPRVDALADREHLNEFDHREPHKIILNGWFMHRPDNWPPSPVLRPLITSFHISKEGWPNFNPQMLNPEAVLLGPDNIDYLKRHEPIGTRDLNTRDLLHAAGVDAYFSGCLTLTLQRPPDVSNTDLVCAVDLSPALVEYIRQQHRGPVAEVSHTEFVTDHVVQMRTASARLAMYASARAVVTTRLHCALPCLAFGTPVLFVDKADDLYRFSGLRELLRCATEAEVLGSGAGFDLANPPENFDDHLTLADRLRATCENFIQEKTAGGPDQGVDVRN